MLVLDASGSMGEVIPATGRSRIEEVNRGLVLLRQELAADPTAVQRVQLGIVGVGGPTADAGLLMGWTDVAQFQPPNLTSGGRTPLGKAMRLALQYTNAHKQTLRSNGINYTRPWLMIISDGLPTDEPAEWQKAVAECRAAEAAGQCVIYPIGVADAQLPVLQQLSSTPALRLAEAHFRECFQWLASSLSSVSRSRPGEHVQLAAVNPWAIVG